MDENIQSLHKSIGEKKAEMKRILALLSDENRDIFKRMYSRLNLNEDINLVVDNLPEEKVDWALTQCKNTYYNLFKIIKESDKNNS